MRGVAESLRYYKTVDGSRQAATSIPPRRRVPGASSTPALPEGIRSQLNSIKRVYDSEYAILVQGGHLIQMYRLIYPFRHHLNMMPSSAYQKKMKWLRQVVDNETWTVQSE